MLNKYNFKVREFASKEQSRYTLQAIQVTREATVATDGHKLMWVSTPAVEAKDFPVVPGAPPATNEFDPFLLDSDTAKIIERALPRKDTYPVLLNAALGYEVRDNLASMPVVTVTDLQTPQSFRPRRVDGTFPNYEAVIPRGEVKVRFAVNAGYLAEIAKFAKDFTGDSQCHKVVVTVYDKHTAIRFDAHNSDTDQGMTALLMPLRIEDNDDVVNSYGYKQRQAEREAQETANKSLSDAAD